MQDYVRMSKAYLFFQHIKLAQLQGSHCSLQLQGKNPAHCRAKLAVSRGSYTDQHAAASRGTNLLAQLAQKQESTASSWKSAFKPVKLQLIQGEGKLLKKKKIKLGLALEDICVFSAWVLNFSCLSQNQMQESIHFRIFVVCIVLDPGHRCGATVVS